LYKRKVRHIVKTNGSPNNLLKAMQEIIPEKGLVVIYCENTNLYLMFQETFRQYFSSNTNLRILKSCILLEDITDKEKMLNIIEKEHLKNNHRGINEIFLEIKQLYYYPNLIKEIQKYINNCSICNAAKYDRHPIKYNLCLTETPEKQNDVIHMDIWFPQRNIMYLTAIDKLTKYATCYYLKDRTWIFLLNAIKLRIQYLGKPNKIVTDNEFNILIIKQYLQDNDVQIHFTTPYKKTGNSDIERLHLTLNEHIRLFNADPNNNDTVQEKVLKAIILYNNTIHSTTSVRPIDFLNNLLSLEDISNLSKKMEDNKRSQFLKQTNEDNRNFENEFVNNNKIGKSQPKYKQIEGYKQDGNYLISSDNPQIKIYKDQIKRKYNCQEINM